jgi:hypothetical protein
MTNELENEYVGVNCPNCKREHKLNSVDGRGWWKYETGKWCCDCGADGLIWYAGEEISRLE